MPDTIKTLKSLRQTRSFDGSSIGVDDLQTILEVARWTGSARNKQPWQLIVVDDREQMKRLGHVREMNSWMESAACAIAVVMPEGSSAITQYDEGRLSERIMLAAEVLGYGSGTAWFTKDEEIAAAKTLMDVPEEAHLLSVVVIGKADTSAGKQGTSTGGRKPLEEIVSYNTYGNRQR